ncbi:ABC transporter G family member 23-like [Daphnia carinata]|uniref:ABC transporter G family member 23-like n=1 Tax=Daphnia carinata TaxID=120202 RepID=UPI00257C9403|nr:ABC transporter G family member 23-like [Daphnia carinata]XP_057369453.1 ABC transporter G family member 23-like [Daphnia carinata]
MEEIQSLDASSNRIDTRATGAVANAHGVLIRKAVKTYGSGKNSCNVLQGLDMSVKRGTIYGLLGASGCGKTTLLSCVVGSRGLNSGEITVLGHETGSVHSGVPGPNVGYMPQELALYGNFTIKETLFFFGAIYKLKAAFINSQCEFLCKLLDLPACDRYVKTLSGGQQRRVSFTVALFHEPELLILDEPTVGVDPVLRHSIWNHLIRQSVEHGRTVIVTTHYIEEARNAHTVGMMRSGRLLVEDSPENLLRKFQLSSLEDVFVQFCMRDDGRHSMEQTSSTGSQAAICDSTEAIASQTLSCETNVNMDIPVTTRPVNDDSVNSKARLCKSFNYKNILPCPHRLSVLIRKDYMMSFRSIGLFLLTFLMTVFQTAVSSIALGNEPIDLRMAIVNDELDPGLGRVCTNATDCEYSMLSCRYLRYINDKIIQVPYENISDAMEAGRRGHVWGVVHFGRNFTEEFEKKDWAVDLESIIGRRINVHMDTSNQQVAVYLHRWLVDAYDGFVKDFSKVCGQNPEAEKMPIMFLDPVYGREDAPFKEYTAAGRIISIIYTGALLLTATTMVIEKEQGLLDRNLVAGVQMHEILISNLMSQFMFMVGQTALTYLGMLLVFNVPCYGNVVLAVLIGVLQGIVGMCFGLLIAVVCDNMNGVISLSTGNFMMVIVMGGMLWPIEGLSYYLRDVVYCLPSTSAIKALRYVMIRGWGLEKADVFEGVLASLVWSFGLLALCVCVLRYRKNSS